LLRNWINIYLTPLSNGNDQFVALLLWFCCAGTATGATGPAHLFWRSQTQGVLLALAFIQSGNNTGLATIGWLLYPSPTTIWWRRILLIQMQDACVPTR